MLTNAGRDRLKKDAATRAARKSQTFGPRPAVAQSRPAASRRSCWRPSSPACNCYRPIPEGDGSCLGCGYEIG